jgi:hypothetical protein
MNTTNSNLSISNSNQISLFINTIGNIYIIPSICVIGFVLNITCLILLTDKSLKGNIYKYFILKTLSELIRVILGSMFPIVFCNNCATFQTQFSQVFRVYIISYGASVMSTISILSEIALTYDRLVIFKIKKKYFPHLKYKPACTAILLIGIFLFFHLLFVNRVVEIPNQPGRFRTISTEFGSTSLANYLTIIITCIQSFGGFFALISLNISLLIEFQKYKKSRQHIIGRFNKNLIEKTKPTLDDQNLNINAHSKMNIIKMEELGSCSTTMTTTAKSAANTNKEHSEKMLAYSILMCCSIYGINRLANCLSIFLNQYSNLLGIGLSPLFSLIIYICRLINFLIYSCNLLILALFNRKFRSHLKSISCSSKK